MGRSGSRAGHASRRSPWSLATVGAIRSDHAWNGLAADRLGPFQGWARLVDDPQPYPSATRVVFDIDGERFETWSRGRAQQQRIASWNGGDWVSVSGVRTALDAERARRVASQHVVGAFDLEWAERRACRWAGRSRVEPVPGDGRAGRRRG